MKKWMSGLSVSQFEIRLLLLVKHPAHRQPPGLGEASLESLHQWCHRKNCSVIRSEGVTRNQLQEQARSQLAAALGFVLWEKIDVEDRLNCHRTLFPESTVSEYSATYRWSFSDWRVRCGGDVPPIGDRVREGFWQDPIGFLNRACHDPITASRQIPLRHARPSSDQAHCYLGVNQRLHWYHQRSHFRKFRSTWASLA